MRVVDFVQYAKEEPDVKHVLELEGKTKDLLSDLPVEYEGETHHLVLIPEFQGAWMRVRITVELVESKHGAE